jgi:hypothetical protein
VVGGGDGATEAVVATVVVVDVVELGAVVCVEVVVADSWDNRVDGEAASASGPPEQLVSATIRAASPAPRLPCWLLPRPSIPDRPSCCLH